MSPSCPHHTNVGGGEEVSGGITQRILIFGIKLSSAVYLVLRPLNSPVTTATSNQWTARDTVCFPKSIKT